MPQTTIDMNSKTLETIAELKEKFNVKTNSQVIRRALALARFAAQQAGSAGEVTLIGENNEKTTVFIAS